MKQIITKIFWFTVGVVFAGFGIYLLFETSIPSFLTWQEMKDWQPAQARLLSVDGSDSQTRAAYQYTIADTSYKNDHVYVNAFNDNIGKYHERLRKRLNQAFRAKQPVRIYYNPVLPAQSVIDRDMRWGLFVLMTLFCLVFLVIGLTISIASLRLSSENQFVPPETARLKREWELKRKNDPSFRESFIEFRQYRLHNLKEQEERKKDSKKGEPVAWQNRKEWQTDHIRSDAKSGSLRMWIFAVLWLGISSPIFFLVPAVFKNFNFAFLIATLFPAAGLFLLFKAVRLTGEYLRFGRVEFVMDPYPGSIGGQVGGWLDLQKNYDERVDYRIELQCVFTYMSGMEDEKVRLERIKWFQTGMAQKEGQARRLRLLFCFDVPEDLPEADTRQQGDYYFWRIKAHADMHGIDFKRSYNIPVYPTGALSQNVSHNLSFQMQAEKEKESKIRENRLQQGQFNMTGLKRSVRIKDAHSEFTLYFPMFRNKLLTFSSVLFSGFFGGVAFALISHILDFGMIIGIIMGIFALPFTVLALFTISASVYLPFNTLSVTFSDKKIRVQRRLLIFPISTKTSDTEDIRELILKRSGSTGSGSKKVEHFKILARTDASRELTLAEDIDGRELAHDFKDYLSQRFFTI